MEQISIQYICFNLKDPKALIDWCMNVGLIADKCVCAKCNECMKLCKRADSNDKYAWRCKKSGAEKHDVRVSVRKNSWFERSNLSMYDILLITHMWCTKASNECIKKEVNVANQTVVDWCSFCREVCVELCVRENEMLGGENVIVEIDESKFGKRKYNKGKRVDGKWVFGGIERGSNKCFMCVVEERSANVLLDIIKKYILPGTTIISDCWRAYQCLSSEGYQHLTVNHSLHFKDPETGAHTNTIEGTWGAIKRGLRHSHGDLSLHLFEYIWRRRHQGDPDLTRSFLEGIKIIYPPQS